VSTRFIRPSTGNSNHVSNKIDRYLNGPDIYQQPK
jgi:hypothetical protein